ncbi:MAG: protein translocase subunit SecF [Alphaproteobacteria bacterium]|nr:protein translocase subunit SecF [Alphaproteobacteria bacterium]
MRRLIDFIPIKTDFKVMKRSRIWLVASAIMVALSISVIATRGFAWGIDFSGGILVEVKREDKINIDALRAKLAEFSPQIQSQGSAGDMASIYIAHGGSDEAAIMGELAKLRTAIGTGYEYRNVQIVGPKVGADLVNAGILAVILSVIVMSLYIGIRFEFPFAMGALISITHDVILALAIMSVFGINFDLITLAALMTLVGYSLNDTIVIYDRVRENIKKFKTKPLPDVIDQSINETFSRTVITGITTVLPLSMIYLFGGTALADFALIMLLGLVFGIWSSLFISTSILLRFKQLGT